MTYANKSMEMRMGSVTSDPRIQRALGSAWDGTEQGIALLASTISALGPMIKLASGKAGEGTTAQTRTHRVGIVPQYPKG